MLFSIILKITEIVIYPLSLGEITAKMLILTARQNKATSILFECLFFCSFVSFKHHLFHQSPCCLWAPSTSV